MNLSADELTGLSEDERAALAGDADEAATLTEIIGDGDGDGDDAAGESAGAEAAPAGEADELPFVPRFVGPDAADVDSKLAAVEADRSSLYAQFDEGDLTTVELREKLAEIDATARDLHSQKIKAEIAADQASQTATQRWEWEVGRFMRAQAKDGIEYRMDVAERALEAARAGGDTAKIEAAEANFTRTQAMSAALDAQVKRLASDEANEDKPSEWFLEEAHKRVARAFNLSRQAAAATPADADPVRAAVAKRRADLKGVPSTLAHLPNAGGEDASVGEGKWAHLDSLGGMDLERALARMSADEQQEYARA